MLWITELKEHHGLRYRRFCCELASHRGLVEQLWLHAALARQTIADAQDMIE